MNTNLAARCNGHKLVTPDSQEIEGASALARESSNGSPQQPHDNLAVVLDHGQRYSLSLEDLLDDDLAAELREKCAHCDQPRFEVADLLAWTDEARWKLLELMHSQGQAYRLFLSKDSEKSGPFGNLLDAVLVIAEDGDDIERSKRSLRAAKEAAALEHFDAPDIAANRIVKRFKEIGVKGLLPQSVNKDIRALLGEVNDETNPNAQDAADCFLAWLAHDREPGPQNQAVRYFQDYFWTWNMGRWLREEDNDFKAKVVRFLQQDERFSGVSEVFVRSVLTHLQGRTLLDCREEQMPFLVAAENPVRTENRQLIVLQNGILDLDGALQHDRQPKLRDFDSRYFTRVALPYSFVPDVDCPLWEKTLKEIFPPVMKDEKDRRIDVLQEFMGLTLVPGDTSFEKMLIMVGRGSNGKSTILKTWVELLGKDNVSHVPLDAFDREFRLHETCGKLANIAPDMQYIDKVAEGCLKGFVSGDPVSVNRKNKPPLTLTPSARLVFSTNKLPVFADRSDGMWRRLIVMPFLVQFSEQNSEQTRDLCRVDRLTEELPGILNWALEGARRLSTQGRFTECHVCQREVHRHRFDSDPFQQFIADEAVRSSKGSVQKREFYERYREWCKDNGRMPINSGDFCGRVLDLPWVQEVRPGGGGSRPRVYRGIDINPISPIRPEECLARNKS